MKKNDGQTVASISFNDNRSLSLDVESVTNIELGPPMDAGDGDHWFVELIVRTEIGSVALQLLSDDPEKLRLKEHG
ncbi:MAG: hypothetical protein HOO00_02420 [Rhodospirillaceae bacterium]|jgi:hypothetical protein|nr:hypothetical protein [Rhodospirillaceae bacterium]MBT5375041.1 hypothetical protein [Rhodospirillaceae bacterium]MBT5658803.1 hypothetical protein [Rhodospirillaceae bacterium]